MKRPNALALPSGSSEEASRLHCFFQLVEEAYWSLGATVLKLCSVGFKRAFEKRILWSAMIEKHCMLYPPSQESHITKDHVGGSEKLLLGTLLGGLTVLSVQPCASTPRLFGGTKWTRAGAATTQSFFSWEFLSGAVRSGFFPVEDHG